MHRPLPDRDSRGRSYFNPPLGGGSKLRAPQGKQLRGGDQPQAVLQIRNCVIAGVFGRASSANSRVAHGYTNQPFCLSFADLRSAIERLSRER